MAVNPPPKLSPSGAHEVHYTSHVASRENPKPRSPFSRDAPSAASVRLDSLSPSFHPSLPAVAGAGIQDRINMICRTCPSGMPMCFPHLVHPANPVFCFFFSAPVRHCGRYPRIESHPERLPQVSDSPWRRRRDAEPGKGFEILDLRLSAPFATAILRSAEKKNHPSCASSLRSAESGFANYGIEPRSSKPQSVTTAATLPMLL